MNHFLEPTSLNVPEGILFGPTKQSDVLMCKVCPKACLLKSGETGYCGIRFNSGNKIISKTFEKTTGLAIDPVEKKPLYHFQPGSDTLSIGGIGCNLSCAFCQNYSTSQQRDDSYLQYLEHYTSDEIINYALKRKLPSISVTYNEPTINIEYLTEISDKAHQNNLFLIAVTNGFLQKSSAEFLSNKIDAANVDFKGPKDFYRNICDARQTPVKHTIETWVKSGMHIEITTLVIPGFNDSKIFIAEMTSWIASLNINIPLHFSRYFPRYKFVDAPVTPLKTLINCRKVAHENGLKYVYIGNVGPEVDDNTYCFSCNQILIERGFSNSFRRKGYSARIKNINPTEISCLSCGMKVPIRL